MLPLVRTSKTTICPSYGPGGQQQPTASGSTTFHSTTVLQQREWRQGPRGAGRGKSALSSLPHSYIHDDLICSKTMVSVGLEEQEQIKYRCATANSVLIRGPDTVF